MIQYSFEWDEAKSLSNQRKHGVAFEEARSCFFDVFAIESFDIHHSAEEDRFFLIGMSEQNRVLAVAFTLRAASAIRIISAREALRKERRDYEEQTRSR